MKKDIPLDYMGDRIPREMLPREAGDNRFTENRGGDRRGGFGGRSGGGRGYGGGGGRRFDNDRSSDNNSRGASAAAGSHRGRPAAASAERTERSFNSDAGDRDRSAPRMERSERPAGYRGAASSAPRRADVPGVKRHRSSDNNSQGARASKRS
ncbi:hypothetical protein D3C87_1651550 [compost metagenome]